MTESRALPALIFTALILPVACTQDQPEGQSSSAMTLGTVDFPISCGESVSDTFNRAVALLHSFEYREASADFKSVAGQDPTCGMAYWGEAMTHYHPIWTPPTATEFAAGNAAAEKAEAVGVATDRERAYVAAISAFYGHGEERPHRVRAQDWSRAMKELSEHFPDDSDATIFYALSLLGTADAADSTLGNQKKSAAILNELWAAQKNHPGIAHYLIHSLDYPALAAEGLPAARVYAGVAPSSAHALHMPSHIFTRVGLWEESIATNINSRDAARDLIAKTRPGVVAISELHAQDYLEYAYLQIDDQTRAQAVVAEVNQGTSIEATSFGAAYALAAVSARWALERRDWQAATAVTFTADMPLDGFPYIRAIAPFARALGAARTGQTEQARAEVEKIREVQLGLIESPIAGPYDWASNVEAMRLAASAWVAHAEKHTAEALDLARSAADLDEATGKHPVTPGSLLPPRELLGDMLMELDRPAEALVEYEQSLREAPNRFNSIYGGARAAELSGNPQRAKDLYAQLVEMTVEGSTRSELEHARAFLGGRGN